MHKVQANRYYKRREITDTAKCYCFRCLSPATPQKYRILASRFKGKLVRCGTRQADRGGEFKTVKLVSTNFLHYAVPTSSAPKKKPKNNLTGRRRYPRQREVVLWLKANLGRAHISYGI